MIEVQQQDARWTLVKQLDVAGSTLQIRTISTCQQHNLAHLGLHLLELVDKLVRIGLHKSNEPAATHAICVYVLGGINHISLRDLRLTVLDGATLTCGSTRKRDLQWLF